MITLVIGGAASGKSAFAEELAASGTGPVTYLATATVGDDPGMGERVARHRARRPPGWRTEECGADLIGWLATTRPAGGTLLVESLGTWVAATTDFACDGRELVTALRRRAEDVIVVSEEVGLGVHPSTALGGAFRDALGAVNQAVSAVADAAYLVVAGRPLRLPDVGTGPA